MSKDEVQDVKLMELDRRLVKLEEMFEASIKKLVAALLLVVTADIWIASDYVSNDQV